MTKPLLLVVMDGVGFSQSGLGDAVTLANTPTLDKLLKDCPNAKLKAHGVAVGLPSDEDMGNSEVGHNALGCGQVYSQGAKLVNESIESGKMYTSAAWEEIVGNVLKNNSTLHFLGLLSDGNVHSNTAHLFDMLRKAKAAGVKTARVHVLLDGRDVPSTSALEYIADTEKVLAELNDGEFDGRIASGGGRMKITMDRYKSDWNMVDLGWKTHVLGIGQQFNSAADAVEAYRAENPGIIDQDLPPFVIADDDVPVGRVVDGDSLIYFNFRGDRAIEISMAFDDDKFPYFDREKRPKVCYAGMLQYDGDLLLPRRFLVSPPEIKDTLSEFLVKHNVNQYAVSETQKYGHVTYFWNGNRSGKFSEVLETYNEIPSDRVSFDERPWMKSAEITDDLIAALKSGSYGFIRCNFPNGDMVGHTGSLDATITSVEAVDLALARLIKVCDEQGVILIVTADHGNADEMLEKDKKGNVAVRTAHSLNKVPFIIYDRDSRHEIIPSDDYGLANVAATVAKLLGLTPPDVWEQAMI
ncbi:MAG: 2,3-bisphosphoglycerate-independent phosphoglycerate mutase [Oscillospiraceae bacterium]|jgi:2,3-bisphosphoglycerate-independent phosphoglycerate mutase|nr:2,3-bisphosphoglycerate-independent phosphoglycerate mutase [Oscillospiraceae bacterium]